MISAYDIECQTIYTASSFDDTMIISISLFELSHFTGHLAMSHATAYHRIASTARALRYVLYRIQVVSALIGDIDGRMAKWN
jgi:hypothetical protein